MAKTQGSDGQTAPDLRDFILSGRVTIDDLRQCRQWVLWKYEQKKGKAKPAKVPYGIDGKAHGAIEGNRDYWGTYGQVAALVDSGGYSGVGVVLTDGLCGIDIDGKHFPDGHNPEQDVVIELMDSYTEKSPSGQGVHILFTCDLEPDEGYYTNNQASGLECYIDRPRFFTFTGDAAEGYTIESRTERARTFLDTFMVKETATGDGGLDVPGLSYLTDEQVLAKAGAARNAEKFQALMRGEYPDYGSQSDADSALCCILAFWCGGDVEQIDRLFRHSQLYRPKWDESRGAETYGDMTIRGAVALQAANGGFYSLFAVDDEALFRGELPGGVMLADLNPQPGKRNEVAAGKLFADAFRGVARYSYERKGWFLFDGKRWVKDNRGQAVQLCKALAKALGYHNAKSDGWDGAWWHGYLNSKAGIDKTLALAQSENPVLIAEMDSDPLAFNCLNGTLMLGSLNLVPHNPDHLITKLAPVAYDPDAKCGRWDSFLNEITCERPALARFLQKATGYALSGSTHLECFFILYGATTRNGKSTFCETVLGVMGDYGKVANPETIGITRYKDGSKPSEDIARLAGVRYCNISEPGKGLVLDVAKVKTLTGGDTIAARFLFEGIFEYRPAFKLFINTNYRPTVNDTTLFSSGRVFLVPFDRHFVEQEQDKGLKRLFSRPESRSAVLNWALDGYKALMAEGLKPPEEVTRAVAEYERESDTVAQFMADCLVPKADAEVRTAEAYDAYLTWCAANDQRYPEKRMGFLEALKKFGWVERKRPRSGCGLTTLLLGYELVKGWEFEGSK